MPKSVGLGNSTNTSVPTQIKEFNNCIAVSAGDSFAAVVKSDGSVWMCGNNLYGQLGIGNNTDSNVPEQISGFNIIK
ncbi:MAG: hypothetical protein WC935_00565 [Thermoleophilia bacterium]